MVSRANFPSLTKAALLWPSLPLTTQPGMATHISISCSCCDNMPQTGWLRTLAPVPLIPSLLTVPPNS